MSFLEHLDERGSFAELVKVSECGENFTIKQVSLCKINPGFTRGKHWHKETTEMYIVLEGEMIYRWSLVQNDGNRSKMLEKKITKGNSVFVNPLTYHEVFSQDGATFFILSNKEFDPQNTDTYK